MLTFQLSFVLREYFQWTSNECIWQLTVRPQLSCQRKKAYWNAHSNNNWNNQNNEELVVIRHTQHTHYIKRTCRSKYDNRTDSASFNCKSTSFAERIWSTKCYTNLFKLIFFRCSSTSGRTSISSLSFFPLFLCECSKRKKETSLEKSVWDNELISVVWV